MEGDDEWSANPFQNPSVRDAHGTTTTRGVTTMRDSVTSTGEFNPFSPVVAQTVPIRDQYEGDVTVSAVPLHTGPDWVRAPELAEKEAELKKREEELAQRKLELDEKEANLQQGKQRVPNWPPFPKWCPAPFKPWIYHSIPTDIPADCQANVRHVYAIWFFTSLCYLINFIAALSGLGCRACGQTTRNVIIATFFLVFGVVVSFNFWYRTLYNGFRKDRSVNFMIFFFVFGFQILTNIYFTIGVEGTGACGWMAAYVAGRGKDPVAIVYIISSVFWTLNVMGSIVMIIK
eukprot:Ihof_evm9s16 gene=Ihof_evmTU9s16